MIDQTDVVDLNEIPQISGMTINVSSTNLKTQKRRIIIFLLCLKAITGQQGSLTKSSKNTIYFKIKKGEIVGCNVLMNKVETGIYLKKLLTVTFPNEKEFNPLGFRQEIQNTFSFTERTYENYYEFLNEMISLTNSMFLNTTAFIQGNTDNNVSECLLVNSGFPIKPAADKRKYAKPIFNKKKRK
jgi:hypothetical protein